MANIVLPALTSLIGLVFASVLARRFLHKRRAYELVWCLGLLWYALAAGAEALGGVAGWTPALYKLWYVTGAIGVAAYLGAGTLYLHKDQPFGSLSVVCILGGGVPALATNHLDIGFTALGVAIGLTAVLTLNPKLFPRAVFAVLATTSIIAAARVANAPVDITLLPANSQEIVSGQAFDADIRTLPIPFNVAGTLVLVLGAGSSAIQFWRTRTMLRRVASNALIVAGAVIVAEASGLTRFGVTALFFVGQLVGMLCLLGGFLLSGQASPSSAVPRRFR